MDRGRSVVVSDSLFGTDDGELFLSTANRKAFLSTMAAEKRIFRHHAGFGLRSVSGEATGYTRVGAIRRISRAGKTVRAVRAGQGGTSDVTPQATNANLYTDTNPLGEFDFAAKVKLLEDMNDYARSLDDSVTQFSASISGEWQAVQVVRADGERRGDIRPLVRVNVSIVCSDGDRMEAGSHGTGGRTGYAAYIEPDAWQAQIDEAFRQAHVNMNAVPAPAGAMDVVLGPGWTGILLLEAFGHGLEGDFNRKKPARLGLGERIASPGVTVVDDGTIADRRGSLSSMTRNTYVQHRPYRDGILTGYMRIGSTRLMGVSPTGNGRRRVRPRTDAADDQYHACGRSRSGRNSGSVRNGLRRTLAATGRYYVGEIRVLRLGNLSDRRRQIGAPVRATIIGNGPDVLTP